MGLIYRGIPEKLALELKIKHKINYFVETGTLKGKTARWASRYFKKVYTVELNHILWNENLNRDFTQNIEYIFGDSREILSWVINQIKSPILFWLDAHWSKDLGYERPELGECPVLDEIRQINLDWRINHVIMIDDARLFINKPSKPHRAEDWPTFKDIESLLNRTEMKRIIRVIDDVIIAEPET